MLPVEVRMPVLGALPAPALVVLAVAAALVVLALQDVLQTRHSVRRVYPLIGRLRYLVEQFGPELRQYIVTNDLEERPYSRARRSWVYQTSKGMNSAVGFGTQQDPGQPGSFHFLPSPFPALDEEAPVAPPRVVIGPDRPRPYQPRSYVNLAPMSFGALSAPAIRALSAGAAQAGCWINTGEGGLSPYHLEGGGDVVYQFGAAKYGVRTPEGELDEGRLAEIGALEQVRAVECKIGQGAKPGKGGILPGGKVTAEIAASRGIVAGQPSHSPNRFREFSDTAGLLDFVERVQRLVPVPVGVKIAVGNATFLEELARERAATGRGPDYLSIDGAEGGTGAAPPSLADHMGLPLHEAIVEADNAYRRHGVRDRIVLIGAGRVVTGADAAIVLSLGADLVNVGRGFMLSIGCIQALRCHSNECPTGVATQSRWRQRALVPERKQGRVAAYHGALVADLHVMARSVGLQAPGLLSRDHVEIVREIGRRVRASALHPYPPSIAAPAARPTNGRSALAVVDEDIVA